MLIVQKYGGTSVADNDRIMSAARRIVRAYDSGSKVVVVLSAQGNMTDDLIAKALSVNPDASAREMDMLMATGEQQSAALMAMAIHKLGYPAVSLTGYQAGIHSSATHGSARIRSIDTKRIVTETDKRNLVLVAGFQGVTKNGDITTLGRGASDTTAIALAAALNARLCEIYTDVDGIYTADPRIVKNARKLKEISYDEMLELSSLGANVLASRAAEMAKKYQVNVVVRSSLSDDPGTSVKGESVMENTYISGVAVDREVTSISVKGLTDRPGVAFKIFSLLAKEGISVDLIVQSISPSSEISFIVNTSNASKATQILNSNAKYVGCGEVTRSDNVAKLSVVGAGMASNPGVASKMFEALADAGVNIRMISTSEIKITVLIGENEVERAANYVHDKFFHEGYGGLDI